jgi:predicted DNA-binding transcriptional regulator AlpA
MPITKTKRPVKPVRHFIDKHADRILAEPVVDGADDLLTTAQTATWLGVSVEFLEIGRGKGYGPPHVLLAPRVVRYRRDEVNAWLRERSTANIAARRAKLGA